MKSAKSLGILLAGALVLAGCNTSVNSSIVVRDGESRSGGLASVNGNVTVGKDCEIGGSSKTVNGSVVVGDRSQVEDLATVNGSIRVGEGVSVDGDVKSVNGPVGIGSGSEVSRHVSTVNGSIKLVQTVVKRDVRTVNGDVQLLHHSVVKGDVVIEGKLAGSGRSQPIDIVVAGGSIVEGGVVVKRNVKVRLILREGGKVMGPVSGAEIIDENAAQPAVNAN